jgi:hypothetical protein
VYKVTVELVFANVLRLLLSIIIQSFSVDTSPDHKVCDKTLIRQHIIITLSYVRGFIRYPAFVWFWSKLFSFSRFPIQNCHCYIAYISRLITFVTKYVLFSESLVVGFYDDTFSFFVNATNKVPLCFLSTAFEPRSNEDVLLWEHGIHITARD